MSRQSRNGQAGCFIIDLNTQFDYLDTSGALPVANLDELLPKLRRIMVWARGNRIPVISSIEAHRPDETGYGTFVHCVEGTDGQQKLPFTLLHRRILVEVDNTLSLPWENLGRYRQVIFRKRTHDFFSNPKVDRMLSELAAREYIIIGVGVEQSIKTLVLGLLSRRKRVTVIADACGYWNPGDCYLSLRQIEAKGARVIMVDQLDEIQIPPFGRFARVQVKDRRRRRARRNTLGPLGTQPIYQPGDNGSKTTGAKRITGAAHLSANPQLPNDPDKPPTDPSLPPQA